MTARKLLFYGFLIIALITYCVFDIIAPSVTPEHLNFAFAFALTLSLVPQMCNLLARSPKLLAMYLAGIYGSMVTHFDRFMWQPDLAMTVLIRMILLPLIVYPIIYSWRSLGPKS